MPQSLRLRRGENQVLAALSVGEFDRALPQLELIRLSLRDEVFQPDQPVEYVYFPLTAMFSMVTVMKDGSRVESATIGREGLTGSAFALPKTTSPVQMVCQIAGEAVRMPIAAFRAWLDESPGAREMMDRHAQALLSLVAQTAACNRLHPLEQRYARWLLLTHDRAGADTFTMTQEFLSAMLGVRRPSVTLAAKSFQDRGIVAYHRGAVRILDRALLETLSCECYEIARQRQADVLKRP